CQQGQSYPLTF
nr:immunoglobulin light chain junction region [Macaca mulatta]NSL97177.1 immunoglobulin light chain junction region [Mus musculus]MOV79500.1 immunoglobulin light chain junction region [Macaca mulatta]MOV85580.1 immunoglobulin light chain junction region [Macaca mulatta]NSL97183.1 immunoglobulin light chain junction region [Mus musculus]